VVLWDSEGEYHIAPLSCPQEGKATMTFFFLTTILKINACCRALISIFYRDLGVITSAWIFFLFLNKILREEERSNKGEVGRAVRQL
jgi:hypothetical protein